jgi:Na+-driven multidrug efflux pump/anti-sigma regulatory factor (Ser/Thr protein kinase)
MNHNQKTDVTGYRFCRRLFVGSFANMTAVMLTSTVAGAVDGVFISSFLGVDAMSAFGLTSPLSFFFLTIPGVLSTGLQTVYGKCFGKGDVGKANDYFTVTAVTSFVCAALFILFLLAFPGQTAFLLGARGKAAYLAPMLTAYIFGQLPGLLFYFANTVISPLMYLEGDNRRTMISALVITGTDIAGDALNVSVFHGGLFGMALTTSVSYAAGFLVLASHFLLKTCNIRLSLKKIRFSYIREVISLGLSKAYSTLSNMFRMLFMNYLTLALAGPTGLAVFAIVANFGNLIYAPCNGIGQATLLLGSVYAGEEDRTYCRNIMKIGYRVGFIFCCALALIVTVFSKQIVGFYTKDAVVLPLAAIAISFHVWSAPLNALVQVNKFFYQVIGQLHFSRVLFFTQNFVFRCMPAVIIGHFFGFGPAFWSCYIFGEILTLAVIYVTVWIMHRKMPRTVEDIMLLPDNFGSKEEDTVRMNISNLEDIEKASICADEFCRHENTGSEITFRLALFIEEMAANIYNYGYPKSKARCSIEVLIAKKDDYYILRIRDNGIPFDPVKWYHIHQAELTDPGKNIGIRIVSKMAKDVRYVHMLNYNNLIIKV